jgi:hypothetical protein
MTRIILRFGAIVIALGCSFAAHPALAQRVFVAAQGSDANPCSFARPCRTFQHAHDAVAAGGEINVLDPAGYGAVTITKAISIQGHGFSGISVTTGNTGVTINATSADNVNLNGLLIEGSGAGGNGIVFNSGKSLVVENCVARNMVGNGIAFVSTATALQTLSVSGSYFTDNDAAGIAVQTLSSGGVRAIIERTTFFGNGPAGVYANGAYGTGSLDVAVTDSVASNSTDGSGFRVESAAAHSVSNLVLLRTTAAGNSSGIVASGTNATLRLAQSAVVGNVVGYSINAGAAILSYGDNYIDGNGNNNGTLGSASKQ